MGHIVLEGISHQYGDAPALENVDLEIKQGEFFTLLGPSGCGKTTILRILAGFLTPTQGKILLDGEEITHLPAQKRGMGVVFQNYALFPNMTVEENIAYGLRIRHLSKEKIADRCQYFLELTGLTEYRSRKIDQLSGGQQQRVAIARALIVQPKMLLLDEPLSNLDIALRIRMRQEMQEIQRKTGITTLFITHDQQEALSISHRIAVLDRGRVQQIGTPDEIYNHPSNEFVAGFVGVSNQIALEDAAQLGIDLKAHPYLRPERLMLTNDAQNGIAVTVESVQFEGAFYNYTVKSRHKAYRVLMMNRGDSRELFSVGSSAFLRLVQ